MHFCELDHFFDRKEILDLLKKRVLDLKDGYRQNISFLGSRYLGKTTLLKKFLSELDDHSVVPVYLDCDNNDWDYFYYKMVGSLLYHYCCSEGLPHYDDLALLMTAVQSRLPKTISHIKKIQTLRTHEKLAEAYVEIIALPQVFAVEAQKFCLLVFDEFQELEEWGIPDVYQELGKSIMTQKRCLYVVTSSCSVRASKIISEKLSLLFGNFEMVPVEAFSCQSSRLFVHQLFGSLKINPQLEPFLVDFTGGHPLYLRLICEEIRDLAAIHGQPEVFPPLLAQGIENILFDRWGVLSRHFDLTVEKISAGKGNRLCTGILLALSEQKKNIKDLAHVLMFKQGALTGKLNRLVEEGIVLKNNKDYYVKDKLLRYWLKYVLQKRIRAFDPDSVQQRTAFQKEINEVISLAGLSAQKDLTSRVMELLGCFDDDSFQVNNRRYKLPLFQKVSPAKAVSQRAGHYELIQATTSEGEWCIVLGREKIQESDLSLIVKESHQLGNRPQRWILISLEPLDENTRLKALQERMWIWNEGELNTLLNFYNKPFIVAA